MNETINQRVAKCRKLANLTQTDVAEKLGMKCSSYSQMERKGTISAERLLSLAKIFSVSTDYLLKGEETEKTAATNITTDSGVENTALLYRSEQKEPEKNVFIVTKKEENLLKIIRNFSKPNYDRLIKFIEAIYKEEKY